jgi:hypothetical protein
LLCIDMCDTCIRLSPLISILTISSF